MPDMPSNPAARVLAGASCAADPSRYTHPSTSAGLLGGGCCPQDSAEDMSPAAMGRASRRSRVAAGLVFLAIAGALAARRLPGNVALWPASLVPTWFGISHLVAGMTGYEGCPELGAIPSVMLGRPVATDCELWRRIDSRVDL
jgi:hypothetical protein